MSLEVGLVAAAVGIGLLMGSKKTKIEGPRLGDLAVQTSTYDADIPRVYGTIAVHGNLLWLENNQLRETVKRKKKKGGKGGLGGSTVTTTYSYSATFALGLCACEIAGIRRIWCGDKLIYNAGSDDLETVIASNNSAAGWTLYRGTDDQLPDSRMEADRGVGNVSAYRGIAYIVFRDFQLADYGNSLQAAQFKVELVAVKSESLQLLRERSVANVHVSSSSFSPSPYYISPEKVVFYAPNWTASYPSDSTFTRYEFATSGLVSTSGVQVSGGTGVPPNGDLDQDSAALKSARSAFIGGGSFSGPDGYIQRRGDISVGLSAFLGRKLYARSGDNPEASIATAASCFAIGGGFIAAISTTAVTVYSESLSELYTQPISLPALSYPTARAVFDGDEVLVFSGGGLPAIHAINLQTGQTSRLATLPEQHYRYYRLSVYLSRSIVVIAYPREDLSLVVRWYNIAQVNSELEPLSHVIKQEVALSRLIEADDIDATALSGQVRGYRVSGGTIRAALEPLRAAFPFDVRQAGYRLKLVPRGSSPVAAIGWEDFGASSGQDSGVIIEAEREMDTQLPAKTIVSYLDANREYDTSEQYSERINTPAVNQSKNELPIVLTADEAAGIAEVLQGAAWLERCKYKFNLPPKYLHLETSDAITVTTKTAQYELRLDEIDYGADAVLKIVASPSRASLYSPAAKGAESVQAGGTIAIGGPSVAVMLDLPVIDETLQNEPGFICAMTGYTDGWPGGVLTRSTDAGQTWEQLQAFADKCPIGYASSTLPASSCMLVDQRVLTVNLLSGELESVSIDQMLSGQQYAAYGANGRWEIVRYATAQLNADGSYSVSGFARGLRGTEWATGLHQAQDYFIPLDDPDLEFISMQASAIGQPMTYRAVTNRADLLSASDKAFTYQGVNLEPLSPVYASAQRDSSGNVIGSFTRRSRISGNWWNAGVQVPVGESAQAFEIDVLSGATVKRTISVTAPAFAYSAADQVTDFGSAQASIKFRIYQLSDVVGRGYPLEVTL